MNTTVNKPQTIILITFFSFLFLLISDILAHTYFSPDFNGVREYEHALYVIIIINIKHVDGPKNV